MRVWEEYEPEDRGKGGGKLPFSGYDSAIAVMHSQHLGLCALSLQQDSSCSQFVTDGGGLSAELWLLLDSRKGKVTH